MTPSDTVKNLVIDAMKQDLRALEKRGPHPYHLTGDAWKNASALKRQCESEGAVIFANAHQQAIESAHRRIKTYERSGLITTA